MIGTAVKIFLHIVKNKATHPKDCHFCKPFVTTLRINTVVALSETILNSSDRNCLMNMS